MIWELSRSELSERLWCNRLIALANRLLRRGACPSLQPPRRSLRGLALPPLWGAGSVLKVFPAQLFVFVDNQDP